MITWPTIVQGDAFQLDVSVVDPSNSPVDLTGSSITWELITSAGNRVHQLSTGAGITVIDASAGTLQINGSMQNIPVGTYAAHIRVIDGSGKVSTVHRQAVTVLSKYST